MTDILRNFVTQLLSHKINSDLAPFILENFANGGQLPSRKNLERVFERMVDATPNLRIIVDGFDECSREDQEDIHYNLTKIRGVTAGSCKILISSRNLEQLAKFSRAVLTIRLEDNPDLISSTITAFVESQLTDLSHRFASETLRHLKNQIIVKANGELAGMTIALRVLTDTF